MKDIDLNWLKEELEEWQDFYKHPADKKQHDFFSTLINAVDRLASTERERDELKERLSLVRDQRDAELNKNTQLEAEIARRDAAASKPVAWISERNLKILGKAFSVVVKHEPVMVRPIALYTTPPAASVPDAVDYSDFDPASQDREIIEAIAQCKGWNAYRAAMLATVAAPGGDDVKQG